MPSGIGASITNIVDGTTARAGDVLASLNSLNSSGVSNDGGNIQTDGSGNIQFNGRITTPRGTVFDATGTDTFVYPTSNGGTMHIQTPDGHTLATFAQSGNGGIALLPGNGSTPTSVTVGAGFGVKKTAGGTAKLFEARLNGDFIIEGQYQTQGGSSGISTGQSFDSFDYAEIYPCDAFYSGGITLCPGDNDVLTKCTHDGCHCAMVVSGHPGMILGGEQISFEMGILAIALSGRVQVQCSGDVKRRAIVCTNGRGGIRAMKSGEEGFSLGFALNDSKDDYVGIVLRPQYCKVV